MITKEGISTEIKKTMRKSGITQTELSEITGIRQSNISCMLNGRRETRVDTLFKILNALGMDIKIISNEKKQQRLD